MAATSAAAWGRGASATPAAQRARDAATQFEALLFAQAFAPLAKAIGFYGDTVVASATRAMASAERGGLADRLASMVAASAGAGANAAFAAGLRAGTAAGASAIAPSNAERGENDR